MRTLSHVRHKHLQLDQAKLSRAKAVLRAKSETETIERALSFIVEEGEINEALQRHTDRTRIRKVFR